MHGVRVWRRAAQERCGERRKLVRDERVDVGVDLAHLVRAVNARNPHAVAVGLLDTGEMVAFIHGYHEQCVAAVDSIVGEALEERCECGVVVRKLLHVVRITRAKGHVLISRHAVKVMRIRDVGVRDLHAALLHRCDIGERHGGGHAVEPGEARLVERVDDRMAE